MSGMGPRVFKKIRAFYPHPMRIRKGGGVNDDSNWRFENAQDKNQPWRSKEI
jgi:hypothetical protein